MIAPGALVMLAPLLAGTFFGVNAVFGLLTGALLSGVQLAISMSNTGGAWDNCKKYIESGKDQTLGGKGSEIHKAAVVGDTVGDPLKVSKWMFNSNNKKKQIVYIYFELLLFFFLLGYLRSLSEYSHEANGYHLFSVC